MNHPAKIRILAIAGLFVFLFSLSLSSQDEEQRHVFDPAFMQELNQTVQPVSGSDPNLPFSDLGVLDDLGDARIVGLGGATLCVHEFNEMKHRIFRYLVERFHFKGIAFSCDFGSMVVLDRYINGEEGDLEAIMNDNLWLWFWNTLEIKELFRWMREYNLARPEEERLHCFGICPYRVLPLLDQIREYLHKVSPEFLQEIEPLLAEVNLFRTYDKVETFGVDRFNHMQAEIDRIWLEMGNRREEFTLRSDRIEFETARQSFRCIFQMNDVISNYNSMSTLPVYYSAENALWAQRLYGEHQKIAILSFYGSVRNYFNQDKLVSMGSYLKQIIGEDYKNIVFTFSRGSFYAWLKKEGNLLKMHTIDTLPKNKSLNHLFSEADEEKFILRIDRLPEGNLLRSWLDDSPNMLSIWGTYMGNPWSHYFRVGKNEYDILIHFDRVTASTPLW